MPRPKMLGILFLICGIFGLGAAFVTASDFLAVQNVSNTAVYSQSEILEDMVLVFAVKLAISFALFWLGIRKFELID